MNRLEYLQERINNNLFLSFEIVQERLFPGRKMKILFSPKQHWQHLIEKGFQFTQHQLTFEDFSSKNINKHDLVVPLTIRDLQLLDGMRPLISANPIPIPSRKSTILCNDKYLLSQALMAKSFATYVPTIGGRLAYPFILKKRVDVWGAHSHLISGKHQEEIFFDTLTHPDYFCQEFILGPHEYATHVLFKNQQIVCALNIKYIFNTETPIKGKDTPIFTHICRCPFLGLFSTILEAIKFEGLCCFNYKVIDNHPFIFEINPRFGGSLAPYFFSFIRHIE